MEQKINTHTDTQTYLFFFYLQFFFNISIFYVFFVRSINYGHSFFKFSSVKNIFFNLLLKFIHLSEKQDDSTLHSRFFKNSKRRQNVRLNDGFNIKITDFNEARFVCSFTRGDKLMRSDCLFLATTFCKCLQL